MSSNWVSQGTVWLDGTHYYIREVLDRDCFAPGTRYVALSLVAVESEEPDDEPGWEYDAELVEDLDV